MRTERSYWRAPEQMRLETVVVAVRDEGIALRETICFPGGGGQPQDAAWLSWGENAEMEIVSSQVEGETIWHRLAGEAKLAVGEMVTMRVDGERRRLLSRHHTALHVVNTLAQQRHGAWITGAQIGVEHSRIDFKIEGFSPALVKELEAEVNRVLAEDHRVEAFLMPQAEFAGRPDLLRTLEVQPPAYGGAVRVVAIRGFDEQACGGTHAANTREVGAVEIYRTENKGKINKRLYVRLLE